MFPKRALRAPVAQPVWLPAKPLSLSFTHPQTYFWLSALCAGFLLFIPLQRGDLAGYDDAVYAHEGRQMWLSGDWLNVWLNGRLDFDKPPLFIWLEAASFALWGISDFAAKFPAALLGWLTILLVYGIARQLSADRWLPVLAMLVLASTQYFLKYAGHAMTDVPFTCFFALAIWAYLKAESADAASDWRRAGAWALCGAAIAAALLTRSILGLLLLPILGAHLVWRRRWHLWRTPGVWLAAALAFGPPLLWFALQARWYGMRFVNHHFSFTADNLASIHPQRTPWLLDTLGHYPWLLLKLYWPWLPLLALGLAYALRSVWRNRADDAALLLFWVAGVLLPFSLIESKVLRYVLPAFPAFSLLAALALRQWLTEARCARFCQGACALLLATLLFTWVQPGHRLRAAEMQALAPLAEAVTPPNERLQFFAGGAARWDYVHQLIWYSQRHCDLLTSAEELRAQLNRARAAAFIVDRAAFEQVIQPAQPNQPAPPNPLAQPAESVAAGLQVLGTTAHFVCFYLPPVAAQLPAQNHNNL